MASAPLPIEINYDAERELFGDESEAPDARHLLVEIEGRKLKVGTLGLAPPEDAPDAVVPIRIRAGTQIARGNGIEFRAELDVDAIFAEWGSVEDAAEEEHPILITAEEDTPPGRPKQLRKRRATVSINLNSIRWKWTPLVRDDKGVEKEDGPTQENTTIEVKVDGTNNNGFRLELERMVYDEALGLEHEEADFVHYLSPDHKCDFSVLAPDPIPSEIPAGKSQRQIVTRWWTKSLPADHKIREQLPVDTTIRVRAYQANSIQKHVSGGAPTRKPPDAAMHATREIPLRLGVREWKARLLKPDLNEPPVLMESFRPWENSLEIEFQMFDSLKTDGEPYRNKDLEWEIRPGPEGRPAPGCIRDSKGEGKTSGTWTTDNEGNVSARFCPSRENALFLAGKDNLQFYVEIDVRMPRPSPDVKGTKIAQIGKPVDEKEPTFLLRWAPKFDIGFFKLPFFVKPDGALDLETVPDEEKVEPVVPTRTEEEKRAYRQMFGTGGTIHLKPFVPWEPGEGAAAAEIPLKEYRLVVGDKSRKGDEKRQIIPVDPSTSGSWPQTVLVPTPPNQSGGGTLDLKLKVPLHPDLESILKNIVAEASKLQKASSLSSAVPKAAVEQDAAANFLKLGLGFCVTAIEHLSETAQTILVDKRKALWFTLREMPPFLFETRNAWSRLGASIVFHRQAYKRFEEAAITFYFDVVQWGPAKEAARKAWGYCKETRIGKWIASWGLTPGPTRIGSLLRDGNEKLQDAVFRWYTRICKEPAQDAVRRISEKVRECANQMEQLMPKRNSVLEALGTARQKLHQAADQFAKHADDYMATLSDAKDFMLRGRAAGKKDAELLQSLRSKLDAAAKGMEAARKELAAQVGGTEGSNYARLAREAMVLETQYTYWFARQKSLQEIGKRFADGSKDLDKLLQADTRLDEKAIKAAVKLFQEPPETLRNMVPDLREEGLRFINGVRDDYMDSGRKVAEKLNALAQRSSAFEGVPTGGQLVPGSDWSRPLRDLQSFRNEVSGHSSATQEFSDAAKSLLDQKLQPVHGVWQAEKMLVDQYVKDGLKKGTARGSEIVRQSLDGAPGVPPSSEGMLDKVWELLRSWLNIWDWAMGHIPSTTMSWAIWTLGWVVRIVLVPLNAFFRLVERLLAKVFELGLTVYEAGLTRESVRLMLSSLKTEAVNAGTTAYSNGVSGLGDFFNLPYSRDLGHWKMMKQGAGAFYNENAAFDSNLDEALKTGLKTGYEDYYPSQLKQGRVLLFALCHRVLHEDKRMLINPPCEEDCRPIGRVAATSAETMGRYIDEYLGAGDHQSLSQKGMFQPFWSLATDLVSGGSVNTRKLELLCDWIGWLLAWGLRILAIVLSICILFGAGIPASIAGLVGVVAGGLARALGVKVVTVGALLAGASLVSAISAVIRSLLAALGFYPYSIAYPRDVLLIHGVYFAMVFRPPTERFQAASASDILSRARLS